MKLLILLLSLIFGANAAMMPTNIGGLQDSGGELWTLTDSNSFYDDSGFELTFSYGAFNTFDQEFGLYQYDEVHDSISNTLAIFDSSDTVGTSNNVIWDFAADKVMTRYGNIDLSLINGLKFGFYFQSDGKKLYSQAALNQGGEDSFGFYWDNDPWSTTNLIVYATDNGAGIDHDYIQVAVDDVRPIPEPNSIALLGFSLLGFRVLSKSTEFNI